MAGMNFIAAMAHSDPLDSQSLWHEQIVRFVQDALDTLESREADFVTARQMATFALLEAAASFAVHDLDVYDCEGNPQPFTVGGQIESLADALRIALRGELIAHGLARPLA